MVKKPGGEGAEGDGRRISRVFISHKRREGVDKGNEDDDIDDDIDDEDG